MSAVPPAVAAARSPLDRLLAADAAAGTVTGPHGEVDDWLLRDGARIPVRPGSPPAGEAVAQLRLASGRPGVVRRAGETGGLVLPFDPAAAYDHLVAERWREVAPPRALSTGQLRAFYAVKRFIPRRLQLAGRRALARRQGLPEFPRWPYDASVAGLAELYAGCLLELQGADELRFRWFWPGDATAAAILTHDVESAEGLRLAVQIADLEEAHGLRSSFNIVGDWYAIDRGILRDLAARGFELGVHGIHHDRSLFSSPAEFERQLPLIRAFATELEATGFRSPATHRDVELLPRLPLSYDTTIPHSDPYEPQPGGCCSIWPFFLGDLLELPYTLPQDHTLFTVLGHRTIATWREQADRIQRAGGLIQVVTHPDPGYLGDADKRALYAELLRDLADRPRLWRALPREVDAWWRRRDGAARWDGPWGRIRRGPQPLQGVLEPPG